MSSALAGSSARWSRPAARSTRTLRLSRPKPATGPDTRRRGFAAEMLSGRDECCSRLPRWWS